MQIHKLVVRYLLGFTQGSITSTAVELKIWQNAHAKKQKVTGHSHHRVFIIFFQPGEKKKQLTTHETSLQKKNL